jgi:hypothetical protein
MESDRGKIIFMKKFWEKKKLFAFFSVMLHGTTKSKKYHGDTEAKTRTEGKITT